MSIDEILKKKRIEYKLTQEQLSERIFVSRKTISNWETGKTSPDIDSLIRLAHLFNLSLDNLLLEGSDLVKNIKNQAEIRNTKFFIAITSITNIVFFFVAMSQSYFGYLPIVINIAILIGTLTNILAMFYFINKISKLQNKSKEENESETKKALFLIVLFLILIVVVSLIAYFL